MDIPFLIVVAVTLLFVTAMVIFRMLASGATARQIAFPVVEVWVTLILWVAIFRALSAAIGTPEGVSAGGELGDLGARVARLPAGTRTWLLSGAGIAAALLVHLLWTLGRAMRGHEAGHG
ncbi:MAG: hypothetical protein ABSD48_05535 [Armatimonadota bacterium]